MKRNLMRFLPFIAAYFISFPLGAEEEIVNKTCGKASLSAVYIHVDLLDHGDTTDRMDLPGVRADGCWAFWKGLCIKPMAMWGENDREFWTAGLGLGHITPLNDRFCLTPSVGFTYTYLQTTTSFEPMGWDGLRQEFRSWAPYVSLEATWTFIPTWRVYAQWQYMWTKNHITISRLPKMKERSTGSSYALVLEHDLSDKWSVELGGAYNTSISHEKRGMRAYGFKLGLARWF